MFLAHVKVVIAAAFTVKESPQLKVVIKDGIVIMIEEAGVKGVKVVIDICTTADLWTVLIFEDIDIDVIVLGIIE